MKKIVFFVLGVYQRNISILLGSHCRFHPSCSQYLVEAIKKFGILKGCSRGLIRFLRCNPFFRGGYDPV